MDGILEDETEELERQEEQECSFSVERPIPSPSQNFLPQNSLSDQE